MATVEESVHAHLSADEALTGLVGDRVYPGDVPDYEPALPWVVYGLSDADTTEVEDLDGPTADAVFMLDLAVSAASYATGRDVADAVRTRLNGFSGGQVDWCLWKGETVSPLGDGAYLFELRFRVGGTAGAVVPTVLGLPRVEVRADGLYFDGARIGAAPADGSQVWAAGEALSAHRVVYADRTTGNVYYADPASPGTVAAAVGVTLNAAASGQPVTVVALGVIDDPSWNWSPTGSAELYLGTAGAITQGPPTSGAVLRVGSVSTPTRVSVRMFPPIYR